MDREILQAEQLLVCLGVWLVMPHNWSHHLVGSIVPEIQNNIGADNLARLLKVKGVWWGLTFLIHFDPCLNWTHLWIASSVILSFTDAEEEKFQHILWTNSNCKWTKFRKTQQLLNTKSKNSNCHNWNVLEVMFGSQLKDEFSNVCGLYTAVKILWTKNLRPNLRMSNSGNKLISSLQNLIESLKLNELPRKGDGNKLHAIFTKLEKYMHVLTCVLLCMCSNFNTFNNYGNQNPPGFLTSVWAARSLRECTWRKNAWKFSKKWPPQILQGACGFFV